MTMDKVPSSDYIEQRFKDIQENLIAMDRANRELFEARLRGMEEANRVC